MSVEYYLVDKTSLDSKWGNYDLVRESSNGQKRVLTSFITISNPRGYRISESNERGVKFLAQVKPSERDSKLEELAKNISINDFLEGLECQN